MSNYMSTAETRPETSPELNLVGNRKSGLSNLSAIFNNNVKNTPNKSINSSN
jgi:hypothetical protein